MQNREKGSVGEGALVLTALVVIIVFFILPRRGVVGPMRSFNNVTNPVTYTDYAKSRAESQGTSQIITNSAYSGSVSVGQGNASYSTDPLDEYITIDNQSQNPINLTGWKLVNNKANRTYYAGNQAQKYPSDEVLIPQGAGYIDPRGGFSILQNIILKPGETAIVTTGGTGMQAPYKITSFKENKCSGYIASLPQYDFTPSLNSSCVAPTQESGVSNLDAACKTFISGLSSCRVPTYGKTDRYSEDSCDNCVNGRPAPSSACLAFIKEHYSYEGCLRYHKDDSDFYGRTWRIFLGKPWEMWGKDDEIISLYDQFGKLAAYRAY
jgi:hypothetical protein